VIDPLDPNLSVQYIGRKLALTPSITLQEVPSTSKIIQAVQKVKSRFQCFRCGNQDQDVLLLIFVEDAYPNVPTVGNAS